MKIWILEKWDSTENMQSKFDEAVAFSGATENTPLFEMLKTEFQKLIDNTPQGQWSGILAGISYKSFCNNAASIIEDGNTYRVMQGTFDDLSFHWMDYHAETENKLVLNHIMKIREKGEF